MSKAKKQNETTNAAPVTRTPQTIFRHARSVGTPLIAIETADQNATASWILKIVHALVPVILWDCANGMTGLNSRADQLIKALFPDGKNVRGQTLRPLDFLRHCGAIPGVMEKGTDADNNPARIRLGERVVILMMNAHRFVTDTTFIDPDLSAGCAQQVYNLRDVFKAQGALCSLVMLGPSFKFAPELVNDVVTIEEPLPTHDELRKIVDGLIEAKGSDATEAQREAAAKACKGTTAFGAEQSIAMALEGDQGLNVEAVWQRSKAIINKTPGLEVFDGKETFADVGGCERIIQFLTRVANGARKPAAIVWLDEVADAMGGVGTDSSGVSSDIHGTLLTTMQDKKWRGLIALGVPGSGKSYISKTFGATFGIPTIRLDIGALKGSLVGKTEEQTRNALRVIEAISDNNVFCIASCNTLAGLSPQFKARFTYGTWFFPLPTQDEQEAIWKLAEARHGVKRDRTDFYNGWVGREIFNACDLAADTGIPVSQAAGFIVPVARSGAEEIKALYSQAHGRFLSTGDLPGCEDGVWRQQTAPAPINIDPASRFPGSADAEGIY